MSNRAEAGVASSPPGPPLSEDMVWIPGGTFLMGSDHHYPEEAPVHEVAVDGFWMDRYTVTNRDFRRFVEASGYVTFAEKAPRAEDYPGAKPEMLVALQGSRRPGLEEDPLPGGIRQDQAPRPGEVIFS
jgi:formylglycine-generating enzyme